MTKRFTVIAVLTLLISFLASLRASAQAWSPDVQERIKKAKEVVEANPNSAEAYVKLGQVYYDSGDLRKEAVVAYEKAIQLKPDYVDAFVSLGQVYGSMNKHPESIKAYHRALELNPNCTAAYIGLGTVFEYEKRYEEAIAMYQQAIKVQPDSSEAYNQLALTYMRIEQYTNAFNAAKRYVEIKPDSTTLYFIETIARSSGRYDDAIELLKLPIQLSPDSVTAYIVVANLYDLNKKYLESVETLKKFVARDPENSYCHFRLGLSYAKVGDRESAQTEYKILEMLHNQLPETEWLKKEK